jgi:hypothetical protein
MMNMGIRGTPEMREVLQEEARTRKTTVQQIASEVLEGYIRSRNHSPSKWDLLPPLTKKQKDKLFLFANILCRLPENDPLLLAIDMILIAAGMHVDPAVVKHRPGRLKGITAPDLSPYWDLIHPDLRRWKPTEKPKST